jgi:hypothetical protein
MPLGLGVVRHLVIYKRIRLHFFYKSQLNLLAVSPPIASQQKLLSFSVSQQSSVLLSSREYPLAFIGYISAYFLRD